MSTVYTINVTQADKLASKLVAKLQGGEVLGLYGPLGSGKTAFAQSLAKKLGINKRITSPTFSLLQSFVIPGKKALKNSKLWLCHMDLYRLSERAEIKSLGLDEFLGRADTITLIEWANRISGYLPKNTIHIYFKHIIEDL